jgi:hypothetical protein
MILLVVFVWLHSSAMPSVLAQVAPTKPPLDVPTKPPIEPTSAPVDQPTSVPLADLPTKIPPSSLPTKVPPTSLPTKIPWTSTPLPTTLPTKGPLMATATLPGVSNEETPVPTKGIGEVGGYVTPEVAVIPNDPTSAVMNTSVSIAAEQILIGQVFDDRDGNGVQSTDEPGLAGVALIVEVTGQSQTVVTDASGAYSVRRDPRAQVRVVPPTGWATAQTGALTLDRARNFPLHQREAATNLPTATSTIINLTSVAIGFLGLGAIVWLALWQHQRAQVNSFNAWARADMRLRSEAERLSRRERVNIDETWIISLLNQAALDATGEAHGIDQIDRVLLEPLPAIVGLGRDFERLLFTPAPDSIVRSLIKRRTLSSLLGEALRNVRVYSIDALTSDLFVTDDLTRALQSLADQGLRPTGQPVQLPRTERWWLYVVPHPRGQVRRG